LGIYDEVDNHIDSFETGLHSDLIKKLFEWLDLKTNVSNYDLFSEDEKNKSHKYYHRPELSKFPEEEISVEMPDLPGLTVETLTEARILPLNPMPRLRRMPMVVPRYVDDVREFGNDLFEDLP
jgi:hypothetical protein